MRWRGRWAGRRWQSGHDEAHGTSVVLAPRVERALVVLATHAQQLDGRIDRLERRFDDAVEATLDLPTRDEVLEVRVHSARVAAELARVTVELRAEIEQAVERSVHRSTAKERRIQTLAEQIIDLSDSIDTRPTDLAG